MKQAKQAIYRQGDVLIRRIAKLPTGKTNKRANGVLAYGEVTGHSHAVADLEAAEVLEIGSGLYLSVSEAGVSIQHQEHAPISLPQGSYEVIIQREYTPVAIRNVRD